MFSMTDSPRNAVDVIRRFFCACPPTEHDASVVQEQQPTEAGEHLGVGVEQLRVSEANRLHREQVVLDLQRRLLVDALLRNGVML
jgi:hypothetical protein